MAEFPVIENFNLRNYPVPTLEQGSPFGGVLSNAIAKRLAMANAQKAEAEVPYAGISSASNALSKLTYANLMGPQFVAKMIQNTPQWANMSEDQRKQAINMITSAGLGFGGSVAPLQQEILRVFQQQLNNKPTSLFGSLTNLLGGNQPQSSQNIGMGIPDQNQAFSNAPVTPQSGSNLGSRGNRPLSDQPTTWQNEANYNATQAGAKSGGSATGTQLADLLNQVQMNSQNAYNMENLLESAKARWNKVLLKGPVLGRFAEWGPDAAQVLKETNEMAVTTANQLYGANTTNAKDATAASLKLNVKDPERAFNEYAQKIMAQNERIKGQGTFYETMKVLGITDPNLMNQIWFDFNSKHPPYDYKNHKPIFGANGDNLEVDQERYDKFIREDFKNIKSLKNRIASRIKKQADQNQGEGVIEFVRDENGRFIRK